MKIAVIGLGYVGLSNAILLSKKYEVVGVDLSQTRLDKVNSRECPIEDREMEYFLQTQELNLCATNSIEEASTGASYVIIATLLYHDPRLFKFNTSSVETVAQTVSAVSPETIIIIKSTIPVGFVEALR
jgi:UDPglucose 6-dehydrogenase